jgi:hypothetical protein
VSQVRETVGFILLGVAGPGVRLAFNHRFPVIPVSDFSNLIAFGLFLRDNGLTAHGAGWEGLGAGLPVALCSLFHIFPCIDVSIVARIATALFTGLVALVPFLLWRGVISFRVRALTGAALAFWPGQVLFSGVVAQDNWVILPSVVVAVLAVRALADSERAQPIVAALAYAAAVAVRAEMLFPLLPLLLAAVRVDLLRTRWRPAAGIVTALLALLGLAAYRQAASGKFSLAPQHAGISVLGAYLPGSSKTGWQPPYAFIASTRPELLRNKQAMFAAASGLAVHEALRRPFFQMVRIISMTASTAIEGESASLYWSLQNAEALPAAIRPRADALAVRLSHPLISELALIHALFVAALMIGFKRRNRAILALGAAVLLKYGLHAFGVLQGRYFFVATGLEILAIAVALEELLRPDFPDRGRLLARALAAGVGVAAALLLLTPPLLAFTQNRDINPPQQRVYRFSLEPLDGGAELDCLVDRGTLPSLWPGANVTLSTAPGGSAAARCDLTGSGARRPLALQMEGPPGGSSHMERRVTVNGIAVSPRAILREAGGGWDDVLLGYVGAGTKIQILIELKATGPGDPTRSGAATMRFQLAHSTPIPPPPVTSGPNLALKRPAAQSSSAYVTAGAGTAVDGNTDGNFFHGSVTHTGLEANPWWEVDLGISRHIGSIVIWNRTDCCGDRLDDYWVFISDTPFKPGEEPAVLDHGRATWSNHQVGIPAPYTQLMTQGAHGRYIRVQLSGTNRLSLAEVQVFGE